MSLALRIKKVQKFFEKKEKMLETICFVENNVYLCR